MIYLLLLYALLSAMMPWPDFVLINLINVGVSLSWKTVISIPVGYSIKSGNTVTLDFCREGLCKWFIVIENADEVL